MFLRKRRRNGIINFEHEIEAARGRVIEAKLDSKCREKPITREYVITKTRPRKATDRIFGEQGANTKYC